MTSLYKSVTSVCNNVIPVRKNVPCMYVCKNITSLWKDVISVCKNVTYICTKSTFLYKNKLGVK